MKNSRLVVSDRVKAGREAAILDRAIEQAFAGPERGRWARPLGEMARPVQVTAPGEPAALARAATAALRDELLPAESRPPRAGHGRGGTRARRERSPSAASRPPR